MLVSLRTTFLSLRPLSWARIAWATRLRFVMRRALLLFVAFITLASLLNVLPWVDRCDQAESPASITDGWLFSDSTFPFEPYPTPAPPLPHHHHLTPRVPSESILSHMDTAITLVLLRGPLLLSASQSIPRLTRTPPTPPPRTA
jgi:hypothetical protein